MKKQLTMYNKKYNEHEIIERYSKGESTKSIANCLGTYNTTIRRILLRNNIAVRNQSEAQTDRNNMFINRTPEGDYWLGMLISDGYIGDKEYVIGLGLQDKDLEHLKKYSSFVKANVKSYKHPKFEALEHRVYFKNKAINLWLKSIGITERKSSTVCINIDLNRDILRGILDGDGYVRLNKLNVAIATQSVCLKDAIIKYLKENDINATSYKSKDLFIVGIYKNNDVFKLYNLLYTDTDLFLERKKDRLTATLKLKGFI